MSQQVNSQVTQLLQAAGAGNPGATDELFPLVYDELRRLASHLLSKEQAGAAVTLQPTALVHEAYMRLVGAADLNWQGRAHFFNTAARAMRRILIDRARRRKVVGSRPGALVDSDGHVPSPESEPPMGDDLLRLDAALDELQRRDARQHEVVMLRYFAGLTIDQTATAMCLSAATVKNEWAYARAWLLRQLELARLAEADGEGPAASQGGRE